MSRAVNIAQIIEDGDYDTLRDMLSRPTDVTLNPFSLLMSCVAKQQMECAQVVMDAFNHPWGDWGVKDELDCCILYVWVMAHIQQAEQIKPIEEFFERSGLFPPLHQWFARLCGEAKTEVAVAYYAPMMGDHPNETMGALKTCLRQQRHLVGLVAPYVDLSSLPEGYTCDILLLAFEREWEHLIDRLATADRCAVVVQRMEQHQPHYIYKNALKHAQQMKAAYELNDALSDAVGQVGDQRRNKMM